jgi:hypothetical protein
LHNRVFPSLDPLSGLNELTDDQQQLLL